MTFDPERHRQAQAAPALDAGGEGQGVGPRDVEGPLGAHMDRPLEGRHGVVEGEEVDHRVIAGRPQTDSALQIIKELTAGARAEDAFLIVTHGREDR